MGNKTVACEGEGGGCLRGSIPVIKGTSRGYRYIYYESHSYRVTPDVCQAGPELHAFI